MQFWYSRSWIAWLLCPFSLLFWLITTVRRALFRLNLLKSYRAPIPVVIVGNLSVGGNGKTPAVIWLVQELTKCGLNVGVISRGYGSKAKNYPLLVTPTSDPIEAGDEPVLIAARPRALPFRAGARGGREDVLCVLLQQEGPQFRGVLPPFPLPQPQSEDGVDEHAPREEKGCLVRRESALVAQDAVDRVEALPGERSENRVGAHRVEAHRHEELGAVGDEFQVGVPQRAPDLLRRGAGRDGRRAERLAHGVEGVGGRLGVQRLLRPEGPHHVSLGDPGLAGDGVGRGARVPVLPEHVDGRLEHEAAPLRRGEALRCGGRHSGLQVCGGPGADPSGRGAGRLSAGRGRGPGR